MSEKNCKRLLDYLATGTRTSTEATKRGPLHPRVAGTYLLEMEKRGVLERTEEWVQTRRGKRKAKVISVAVAPPKDQLDVALWKYAGNWGAPAVEPMSTDDFKRLLDWD